MRYRATLIPPTLRKRNLLCNEDKNEDFLIKAKGNTEWKSCKYLGSLFDTEKDIKRRKMLALNAMKDMTYIWESHLSQNTKLRIFNSYIQPIFLSNSELWTTTETINGTINAFQRRLLRYALNIRYPKTMSNQKLKETAKHMEWSLYISTQRLRWLGHALRLPEDSPAKQALYEIEKPTKRTVGRPKLKWIDIVKNQLSKLKITWEETKELSQNRVGWREVVDRWKRMQNATSSCEN